MDFQIVNKYLRGESSEAEVAEIFNPTCSVFIKNKEKSV